MQRMLKTKESENPIQRHRKERHGRSRDRIKAVLAFVDGYSYSETGKILLLDDETIRPHIEDYQNNQKLNIENGGGLVKLTLSQSNKLKQHLSEVTYLYVKDICANVKKTLKKKYSFDIMTKWLHDNNFCYKKQQKKFIKYYTRLKQKAVKKKPIYFVDRMYPQYQTHLTCSWILKGKEKLVPTKARQPRLNFIGGICLLGYRIICRQSDKVDADSIESFLCQLRKNQTEKSKIHIILDNESYHSSKALQDFARNLAIELDYLPPYSPNLNPIERLWKIMYEKASANKYYEIFSAFNKPTLNFFKDIGENKILLRSRITNNFQILHSPVFAY